MQKRFDVRGLGHGVNPVNPMIRNILDISKWVKDNGDMSESTSHPRRWHKSTDNAVGARKLSATFVDDMQTHAGETAGLLEVLTHETRLRSPCHLSGGELSVSEINARVHLNQAALSHHLVVLHDLICWSAGKQS